MANKLISQLTNGAANLQDTDYAEAQKFGETETKKFTGLQMRGVEKAEREAQDNVIEASCGLETDGTFTPPANSWGLRVADYAAGIVDRGGATGALTETLLNGLRIIDAKINSTTDYVILKAGVSADTTWGTIIPAGYMLEYVVFEELAGQAPILSLGTTAGGNEVFTNQVLTTSDITTIFVGRMFSFTAAQTLYINDDTAGDQWDGSTVDVYLCLKAIQTNGFTGGPSVAVMGYFEYDGATWCNLPTNAMIEAVVGLANTYEAGTVFVLKDTDATCGNVLVYFVLSDGVQWWLNSANFSEAV